ncbi:MAG: response regulator transcription factor [Melioribacteraceae bacterium]|nr:response regulator transcription factor [Melioribacteraceae bacterium]
MKKILIVDDEPSMRLGLKDNLELEGYLVELAEDGEEGLLKIENGIFDLIVLDIMMPKISGFDVCKKIRADGNNTSVIFLSAKGEELDKVLGLEFGADDYITKPFSVRELLARIKAILRRNSSTQQSTITTTIGKLTFDFQSFSVFENQKPITMSYKEFEIIHFLWNHKNETVSRDKLLDNIWGEHVYTTSRTIDNFIMKLRNKIEFDPNKPQLIISIHGVGYKLIIK